jgi:tetraacyldisaccharide 4'-kinase
MAALPDGGWREPAGRRWLSRSSASAVGGAGKTPTAIAIARAARQKGLKPGFLTRGYGGSLDVTTRVDPGHHRADAVGDEALLLAREAPTVISRGRVEGARRLVADGMDLIIMDDGFQSARLELDFALVVIDTRRGIGNGHLVPGGPVRAPLAEQMRQLSAILKVGDGPAADALVRQAARAGKQIYVSTLRPREGQSLAGQKLLAFTGIADPEKFYRTATAVGGVVDQTRSFPDHHFFSDDEMQGLLDDARRHDLTLATTAKDAARLIGRHGTAEALLAATQVIEVDMAFDDHQAPGKIIDTAFNNFRRRRLRKSAPA